MSDTSSPPTDLPRYTDLPLPTYRFLPGRGLPHPMRDGGYLSRMPWRFEAIRPPKRWAQQQSYLYGVDLFNHTFWWEAHEAWEELWHRTREPIQHEFVHGLIQLAAALLKWDIGRTRGVRILGVKAIARLSTVRDSGQLEAGGHYMGLHMPAFVEHLQCVFDPFTNGDAQAEDRPVAQVVMPLRDGV